MLAAEFPDHHHRGRGFVHEIPALVDLLFYAPFELFFCDEIIDQSIVEEYQGCLRLVVLLRKRNAVLPVDREVAAPASEVVGEIHRFILRIRSIATRIRSTGRVIANRT
jgi:hypothetical protein